MAQSDTAYCVNTSQKATLWARPQNLDATALNGFFQRETNALKNARQPRRKTQKTWQANGTTGDY